MSVLSLIKQYSVSAQKILPNYFFNTIFNSYLYIRSIKYRGEQVYCPVCDTRFSTWKKSSGGRTGCCPRCLSNPRNRLLWHYIHDELEISEGDRILHIAPGWGLRYYFRQKSDLYYYTNDNDEYATYNASIFADFYFHITDIPDNISEVDLILCSHVLEHVDDKVALQELHGILDERGTAIFLVPLNRELETTKEHTDVEPGHHQRQYGRDFTDRLKKAGFEVSVYDYSSEMTSSEFNYYGFPLDELIFCCEKNTN